MEPIDTLVCARWVLPVEPEGRVLDDHAVAIRSGRIVAVEPAAEARLRFDAHETIERPDHVLLPGLVNAHTHAALVLQRGRAGNLPIGRWLRAAGWTHGRRAADPDFVRDGTELAIAEMLRGGITCFADMQLWPDVVARAASAAHVRASVGLVVAESASSWAVSADEYIDRGMHLRDEYLGDPLVTTHFAPQSMQASSDATLARVRRLADELDLPVAMLLHETTLEVEQCLRDFGQRPLERLAALGLVSPQLVAIHMTQAEDRDIDLLAGSGASIVHCPESNLRHGSGVCRWHACSVAGSVWRSAPTGPPPTTTSICSRRHASPGCCPPGSRPLQATSLRPTSCGWRRSRERARSASARRRAAWCPASGPTCAA